MTGDDIRTIRGELGLNQAEFGRIYGVHGMTVSKWEREAGHPGPYSEMLLGQTTRALRRRPGSEFAADVRHRLRMSGAASALHAILSVAFEGVEA